MTEKFSSSYLYTWQHNNIVILLFMCTHWHLLQMYILICKNCFFIFTIFFALVIMNLSGTGCPVFQLHRESHMKIDEKADITFFTRSTSTCLLACFDFALCEVAVHDYVKCQLFTTRGLTVLNMTLTYYYSNVFYRTCQGAFHSKKKTSW